jgi:hypothetical protein
MTLTIRAQQIVNAGRRINEGGVSLGRLVREGKQMSDLARYEYAAVIREVADRLCTDLGELQCPIDVLREIADEVEAL